MHDLACWRLQVLHRWGRDRDYCEGRGQGKIQGQSQHQAAGAGEGSPPPHRPHHLVQETGGQEFMSLKLIILVISLVAINININCHSKYPHFRGYTVWIARPSLLTFHIVIIVAHVCVLSKQGGAG